jgi:5-deoxy-glucuronate isomerase
MEASVTQQKQTRDRVVFRATAAHKGRRISVTPENSATSLLSYGRIILDPEVNSVAFENGGSETGLICFAGHATVTVEGAPQPFPMIRHDALYVPRDSTITITSDSTADIAEFSAPVEHTYPLQYIKIADVEADPGLYFRTGGDNTSRTLRMLLAKNVQAGRLMAGVTVSDNGHWTSWPPHEHAELAEEMYVYYDMPKEAFALQMVYTDIHDPEFVEVVHADDAVIMSKGYHPNVSVPGNYVRFLWIMAATRERDDRRFGVVNVHPDYSGTSSGLDKGR